MSDIIGTEFISADPATVVHLHRPCGTSDDTAGRMLEAYWRSLRNDGDVPCRSQIDPRAIEGILPDTFVLEQIAPGHARFRVAGSQICGLMDMDMRGMPLTALIAPGDRERFSEAMLALFTTPARLKFLLMATPGIGRPEIAARMTLLPLRCNTGRITRAIGCLAATGPIGRAPRRFAVADCQVAPVRPGQTEPAPACRPAAPQPLRTGQRPHLRLVKSD